MNDKVKLIQIHYVNHKARIRFYRDFDIEPTIYKPSFPSLQRLETIIRPMRTNVQLWSTSTATFVYPQEIVS